MSRCSSDLRPRRPRRRLRNRLLQLLPPLRLPLGPLPRRRGLLRLRQRLRLSIRSSHLHGMRPSPPSHLVQAESAPLIRAVRNVSRNLKAPSAAYAQHATEMCTGATKAGSGRATTTSTGSASKACAAAAARTCMGTRRAGEMGPPTTTFSAQCSHSVTTPHHPA